MPIVGMEIDQEETDKLGRIVLRLVSPGGPVGIFLPDIGNMVKYVVGFCHGIPVYDTRCNEVHSFTIEVIRGGRKILSEKLERVPMCGPRLYAVDTIPGDIVRVITDVWKHSSIAHKLYSSITAVYGVFDPNELAPEYVDIVVIKPNSIAYKKLIAINIAWRRTNSVVDKVLSRVFDMNSIVARAPRVVSTVLVTSDKWTPVAAFPAVESAGGANVPMVALTLSALPVAYVNNVTGLLKQDIDRSGDIAVPSIDYRVCSNGKCRDIRVGPRGATVTASGFVEIYARSVSAPEAIAVVGAQAVIAPADIPSVERLCVGERDYVSIRVYAPARLRVRGLVNVDERVEPGEARIRIPYTVALEKPSGVLDVLVESLSVLRIPTGIAGVSATQSNGTAYATLVPSTTSFAPAIRGSIRLSLYAPKLSADFAAPRHLEPMQTGTATVSAKNVGTCVGVFAASIDGSQARRKLEPGKALVVSRKITMHGEDITVSAEASLLLPGGSAVAKRYSATVRLANAVVLTESSLYIRGGGEENRIRIAVAGVAVKPMVETSVETLVPLPAFAASLTVKPYQEIHVASVTMPQALVVRADKPIWLVVNGEPVEKKTAIVWASNPAAKPLTRVLEDMLEKVG